MSASIDMACEARQHPAGSVGVEPESASSGQILVDEREDAWRRHDVTSGHGKQELRSAVRSSLV